MELENQSLRSHRSSDGTRDSFGSFVDVSNPVTSRRFSTVGLSRTSLPRSSLPEKDTMKRPVPSASTPSVASVAPTSSTARPQRRISLIERSRMSVPRPPSQTVSGVARTTTHRIPAVSRRTSLVKPPVAVHTEPKEPKEPKEPRNDMRRESLKSATRNSVATKQNEKVLISPTKRRRYTVSVNRNNQPSYTFTPSSDRRKTLDSLLMKATKLNESDSSVSNTSEVC